MLNKTAKSNVNTVKSAAADLRDELDSVAATYGRKARELLETAQGEFEDVSDTVSKEISANPLRSGLIALGLGVVIGALIRRA